MSTAKLDKWYFSNGNPAGTVVNMAYATFQFAADNYVTIASNTDYDTPLTLRYKPKFADSMLYIHASTNIRAQETYGMNGGLKRNGAKMYGNHNRSAFDFFYKGEAVNHHVTLQMHAYVNALSTAETTFQVWIRTHDGGGGSNTGEHSWGFGNHTITLFELAGGSNSIYQLAG